MGNWFFSVGLWTGHHGIFLSPRPNTKSYEKNVRVSPFIKGLGLRKFSGWPVPYFKTFSYFNFLGVTSQKNHPVGQIFNFLIYVRLIRTIRFNRLKIFVGVIGFIRLLVSFTCGGVARRRRGRPGWRTCCASSTPASGPPPLSPGQMCF